MFDAVARRYDLVNDLLSLGQDRRWRRVVARAVGARRGEVVLDLAAGTGTSSASFTTLGADCVACDFSLGMLRVGARRRVAALGGGRDTRRHRWARHVRFVAGDALRLPFADASFDAVTVSFGLRNVRDVEAALRELARVTRPRGRLVVCEFSQPVWAPFRGLYDRYLTVALPKVARLASSNPESYAYLVESIHAWPKQRALARLLAANGWDDVGWRNLSGGIVAVHRAARSGANSSQRRSPVNA